MQLSQLLSILPTGEYFVRPPTAQVESEIKKLTTDSREVEPGSVFVALRGTQKDGHAYLTEVLNKGAAGVVADEKSFQAWLQADPATNAKTAALSPIFLVPDTRVALDLLARKIFQDPSQRLIMFGVTGTNGKTSCVYMLEHLLNRAGFPTGVLGTINHHLGDEVWPTSHTTPEPVKLQGRLAEMKSLGAKAVAMEVSSHALDQHRVDGIQFNTVLFTNLTRDHLDYHKTETNYFAAKQKLFSELLWNSNKVPLFAIVNVDDPWGRKLRVASKAGLWTFGESKKADFRFKILKMDFAGTEFELITPSGTHTGTLPMIGQHNVYNASGAIAALATVGVLPEKSLGWLSDFEGVPGRLERVSDSKKGRFIFIDYAHTPDALENVLRTLVRVRGELPAKILTVFGCGGDRDRGKRPLMAQVAASFSDSVICTSDNPRGEDPEMILNEVEAGFSATDRKNKTRRIVDRAQAIAAALNEAKAGDVVLIAGKGHEDYQEVGTERLPFSDLAQVKKFL